MIPVLLLLATFSAGPDVGALRQELDAVASQIAELKGRRLAGEAVEEGALERLLVRSQELAEQLERARPHAAAVDPGGDPGCELVDELREQAAALRDEAEALSAEADRLDAEIARLFRGEPAVSRLAAFTPDERALPSPTIGALADRRAQLELHARTLAAQASILEAAADALERSRAAGHAAARPPAP